MVIFGGSNHAGRLNDMHRFSLSSATWVGVHPSPVAGETQAIVPEPRSEASAVCFEDVMYLFGGNGGHFLDEFFAFGFEDSTWTQVTDTTGQNPPPCRGHSAVVLADAMWVYGGMNTNQTNDLYSYDFPTKSWRPVSTHPTALPTPTPSLRRCPDHTTLRQCRPPLSGRTRPQTLLFPRRRRL